MTDFNKELDLLKEYLHQYIDKMYTIEYYSPELEIKMDPIEFDYKVFHMAMPTFSKNRIQFISVGIFQTFDEWKMEREHKHKFYVNADWSKLKCSCGKEINPGEKQEIK